uniref:FERM, ARHGEF and pleckstrin domain-containing protein 1 n=1 Tax=Gadus morhua TaxID=8049 RepID=A0A8C5AIJ4_GADMO
DLVCTHMNLIEGDYFGLEFQDHHKMTVSGEAEGVGRPRASGGRGRPKHTVLRFVVKFYPPDPAQLLEELTRYLFALQLKQDLSAGRLTCNDSSSALMVSHVVQSEIGDFEGSQSRSHLLNNNYIPDQMALMDRIMEFHSKNTGQTPAESDYQLLEVARRLEMYGVRQHPAKDREGTQLSLAASHTGVLVFQGHTRINAFNWSKVRKLSFKRKRFLIKLRADLNSSYQDTLEFLMGSRDCCKVFWKICVEYHAFFRLFEEPKPKPKPVLFTRGSSFRFRYQGGRTQKQVIDYHVAVESFLVVVQTSPRTYLRIPALHSGPMGPGAPVLSPKPPQKRDGRRASGQDVQEGPSSASPLLSPTMQRFPNDRAYFIAKELLTTERTYLKDLEVVSVSFQAAVALDEAAPEPLRSSLFSNFEPLYKFHSSFLRDLEQRVALWEGRSNAHIKGEYQHIGDVMLKNIQGLKPLTANLQRQAEALVDLDQACRSSRRLQDVCRDFELQKVCYVPLNVFLLRPLHRLTHYKQILERFCKHYPPTHGDFRDCRAALADVTEVVEQLRGSMLKMENFQKLLELKKDLIGIDNLVIPGREFIRLGCLSKLSGKGLQQRMFFLFNDVILYTSRGMTATNQFKVHGQLPLHGMTIRESEDEWGVPNAFTLIGQQQSVVVAASLPTSLLTLKLLCTHMAWVHRSALPLVVTAQPYLTFPEFPEDSSAEAESEDDLAAPRGPPEKPPPHRANTTVHVCWHRNTSVSMLDFSLAVENQLSGNLLRKFKNSNGWQKLWVVFTNFSLFFYKTHQDDYPLASLPLLGYSVTVPSEAENIHKDYVFKLHFKSHVYYFRSESEYTFERWMEVIRSATVPSSRTRIQNRKNETIPH